MQRRKARTGRLVCGNPLCRWTRRDSSHRDEFCASCMLLFLMGAWSIRSMASQDFSGPSPFLHSFVTQHCQTISGCSAEAEAIPSGCAPAVGHLPAASLERKGGRLGYTGRRSAGPFLICPCENCFEAACALRGTQPASKANGAGIGLPTKQPKQSKRKKAGREPVVFSRRFALSAQPCLSLPLLLKKGGEGRGEEARNFPSLRLSPRSFLAGREWKNPGGVLRDEHNWL